jgi:hypothetical protein
LVAIYQPTISHIPVKINFDSLLYNMGQGHQRLNIRKLLIYTSESTPKSLRMQPSIKRTEFVFRKNQQKIKLPCVGEAAAPAVDQEPRLRYCFKLFCFLQETGRKKNFGRQVKNIELWVPSKHGNDMTSQSTLRCAVYHSDVSMRPNDNKSQAAGMCQNVHCTVSFLSFY